MVWGSKEPEGKTVLIIDVENGSVGVALARLQSGMKPRLFAEHREVVPPLRFLSTSELTVRVLAALRHALEHAGLVAARFRVHGTAAPYGQIDRVEVFLSPPWTTLTASAWEHEPRVIEPLSREVSARFGDIPVSVHPFGKSFAAVAGGLFPQEEGVLLGVLTGEVSELLFTHGNRLWGRATVPLGTHYLLRTLKSHGGLTEAEARSALRAQSHSAREALAHGTRHWAKEFGSVAEALFAPGSARSVLLVGEGVSAEHLARALTEAVSLRTLFPDGGTIHAVRGHHLSPFIEAPARSDVLLSIETLFVDNRADALQV